MEKACDCDGTCVGGILPSFGAANKVTKNKKNKYVVALDGHQSAKNHTTTNQKQAAATEGTMKGRRDEREARGSAISLFFGGGKYRRGKNLK